MLLMEKQLDAALCGLDKRLGFAQARLEGLISCGVANHAERRCRETQLETAELALERLQRHIESERVESAAQGDITMAIREQRAASHDRHESQVATITLEHEASLNALARNADARVERLTAALHDVEQLRFKEQEMALLLAREAEARRSLQTIWQDGMLSMASACFVAWTAWHGAARREATTQAVHQVAALLESSDKRLEHQLEQQTSAVDAMMSAMLSSLRQLRWHQETMLTDARDALLHELTKHKCAFGNWAQEEQQQLAHSVRSMIGCQRVNEFRSQLLDSEASHRRALLTQEASTFKHICEMFVSVCADDLHTSYRGILLHQWSALIQDLLSSQHELATQHLRQHAPQAEQHTASEELQREVDALRQMNKTRQDAYSAMVAERDHLAEVARSLELRLGEANLEVLEADLLRSQLVAERASASQQMKQEEPNSSGGIVGSLVRRIWSASQGRTTPSGSVGRDVSQQRPPSVPNIANASVEVGSLPLHRLSLGLPAGAMTPRHIAGGSATPRIMSRVPSELMLSRSGLQQPQPLLPDGPYGVARRIGSSIPRLSHTAALPTTGPSNSILESSPLPRFRDALVEQVR
jgi:hypothetical protein